MKSSMRNILLTILGVFIIVGAYGGNLYLNRGERANAAFYAVQSPATTLYAGISSSASSARLRSFKDIYGTNLTMAMFGGEIGYVTFEPGVSGREEVVSFTGITDNGDGTQTLTGLTRGLISRGPSFGSGGTARSHGSNTYVVVSNAGEFYNELPFKRNAETIDGVWTFNPGALPQVHSSTTNAQISAATNTLATVAYAQSLANTGASDASEIVQGLVEMATTNELANTTATGTTGAPLAIGAKHATTTRSSAALGAYRVLVSGATGYLSQAWLDLTETFSFSGPAKFSGTYTQFTATTSATSSKAVFGFGDFAEMVASTTITGNTTPQPVFISTTTNALNLSDANDNMASQFVGFAVSNGTNGGTSTVQFSGVVQGFSGLTRGAKYYVQDAVGTIGTTVGTNEVFVGTAISATELLMERNGQWEYVGSSICSMTGTSGNCDAPGPSIARFAAWKTQTDFTAACGSIETYLYGIVAKIGITSMVASGSDGCGAGAISGRVTATFTSTSSVRFVRACTGCTSAGADDMTAYFYR